MRISNFLHPERTGHEDKPCSRRLIIIFFVQQRYQSTAATTATTSIERKLLPGRTM